MNLKAKKNYFLIIFFLSIFFCFNASYSKETLSSKKNNCFNDYNNSSTKNLEIKELNIEVNKSRKWFKNILNIYKAFSENDIINQKYKKNYKSNIDVDFINGEICNFKADIRVTGLSNFHFSKENFTSSLDIKLLNGHINNITKFKLLLPKSRSGDNEIFITTLLDELEFIVPKTFYVNTFINGKKQKYIFQEKLTKELLERYRLREGPIYVFSNNTKNYPMLKIENSSWIKLQKEKFISSSEGLSKLHNSYKIQKNNLIDINLDEFDNKKEFLSYNAIMIALNATHGLGIYNRSLYYDPTMKIFRPIYNDGKSKIVNDKNLNDNFFLQNLKEVDVIENSPYEIQKKIENIDAIKFSKKLANNGINLKPNEIISKLKLILKRLNYIQQQNEKIKIKVKNNRDDPKKQKHVFFNSINSLEICDHHDQNCFEERNIKEIFRSQKNLSSGNHIYRSLLKNDFKNINYHYYGNKKIIGESFRNFKQYEKINDFQIFINDQINLEIDYDKKIILISQIEKKGRAIISGKKISNWKINFAGHSMGNLANFNNLTGCLTFIDIEVINIEINTNNGICEDTVNFIRSHGTIKNYSSKNSLSDSLDLDYSEIKINNVEIQNAKNDCIDFSGGNYSINNGLFKFCGDKAISVGEGSFLNLHSIYVENSKFGLASKDGSTTLVDEIKIEKVETCLASYKKKQEFPGGFIEAQKFKCQNFRNNIQKDLFSKIMINKKEIQNIN